MSVEVLSQSPSDASPEENQIIDEQPSENESELVESKENGNEINQNDITTNNYETIEGEHDNDLVDEDDDDDDFDDFEEFEEFEEGPNVQDAQNIQDDDFNQSLTPQVENLRLESSMVQFDGSDESVSKIEGIINGLFKPNSAPGELIEKNLKIELNERCANIYEKMVQEPSNLETINWKKSIIRREMLLDLGIPIDLNEVTDSNLSRTPQVSLYFQHGLHLESADDSKAKDVIKEIPSYLNLEKSVIDSKADIINSTETVLGEMYAKIQPISYYQSILEDSENKFHVEEQNLQDKYQQMEEIKKELLHLASVWDLNHKDLLKDNELFSSYLENLVGNTQKMRHRK